VPRKKRPPQRPTPPPDLTVAILVTLRQQLPDLSSTRLNEVGHHVRDAVEAALANPTPGGRPSLAALVRPRLHALLQELSTHYKVKGRWPDTKSKWDASTERWIKGWWQRRMQDELALQYSEPGRWMPEGPFCRFVPYPAEELAERLGPQATKGTGSHLEVALFLGTTCWEIKPETLRSYLK
jgi:hypothetical protein